MSKLNATDSLRENIRLLEIRQAEEAIQLKDQFRITYESLKPVNLIKRSIQELAESTEVKNNLFESLLAIISAYLSKTIITSKSNIFMKIIRVFAHFGLSNVIINNAETIRNYLTNFISSFFTPKEEVPEREV
ncbi:MAG TPA: hypothetical protein VFG54_16550 [Prolixibacteraceae bacterium]|nr:hypothetical protein [Prolixibacteraceae bacterium]